MIVLDDVARSVVNLLFGLLGVWMAHVFYPSPRKRWQIVTAWVLGFAYCTAAAALVEWAGWFAGGTHEHLSNVIGFGAIFVYLYLFPQIPVAQRVFTYFFIDNGMYILVLLARIVALQFTGLRSISHGALFMAVYLLLAATFLGVFQKKLKGLILQGLSALQNQLPIFTIYACVSYMTMLALIDPWAPMQPQTFGQNLALLLLCTANICGYLLAFYLMRSIRREQEAVAESRELGTLLAISQQYYTTLVDGVEQERVLRHDFVHHLQVMEALHAGGKSDELGVYLAELLGQTEARAPGRWCSCYVANVLLDHFYIQAREAQIACDFDAVIPEWNTQESPKLCVVLGNLLQNALEACRRMPKGKTRFISLLARVVNGTLTIEMRNSFDGALCIKDGRLFSCKQSGRHGLGLSSVRSVLESSGGYFQISHSSGVFVAQAALKVPEQTERPVDFIEKSAVF